jgi:hypothetical protein
MAVVFGTRCKAFMKILEKEEVMLRARHELSVWFFMPGVV